MVDNCCETGTNTSFIKPQSKKAPCEVTSTTFKAAISPTTAKGSCVVAINRLSESW